MRELCACPNRARCEYNGGPCERAAQWSVFTPPGRWIKTFPYGRLHFMCTPCKDYYIAAIKKPLRGIDREDHRYTPAQLKQVYILRRYHRDSRGVR